MMPFRYLDCNCEFSEHVVRFYWLKHEDGDDPRELGYLGVNTQLAQRAPWYKRLWWSIKYVFGAEHEGWAETLMFAREAKELREIIDAYLAEWGDK